jgi:hypothetical protein
MKLSFAAFVVVLMCVLAPDLARAEDPPITIADPASYVATVARQMQTEGMQPLRATFAQIASDSSGRLSPEIDANIVVYERAIEHRPARLYRLLDDVTLADTVRHIYYYHYFGANAWLFTRFEFVRISDQRWALSGISFTSDWRTIALVTTPGFRPSAVAAH